MHIAETFSSLQGEGMLVGVPSFFIRTSGCNLRCRWCDTPYTSWLPEGGRRSLEELMEEVEDSGLRHVVITGGEPLLQREIGELTRRLAEIGRHVTVETAGTVAPAFECDLLSLSPKTSNSDPQGRWAARHRRLRGKLAAQRELISRFPEYQLKLVVHDSDDMVEVLDIVAALGVDRGDRVLLMPEGRSSEELAERCVLVAGLCVEHGFRYTPRLHLDLFGGGRGV